MDRLKTSPSSVDQELFTAICSGGPMGDRAMMKLYSLYHRDITSCLRVFIIHHGQWCGDAEDIMHDSFIVMIEKIREKVPCLVTARAYWLGIAKYLWLNKLKKANPICMDLRNEVLHPLCYTSPEILLIQKENIRVVETYLSHLNTKYRTLMLMWLSDYSMQEIAEHLHLSGAPVARKIKFICCRKLRMMLGKNKNLH